MKNYKHISNYPTLQVSQWAGSTMNVNNFRIEDLHKNKNGDNDLI